MQAQIFYLTRIVYPTGDHSILRYPGYLNRGIVNKLILADVLSLSMFDIIVAGALVYSAFDEG